MALRTAFFGTPDAAVPTLEALLASPHEMLAVLTAPDRPRDRGLELKPSPVKERALASGVPVLQPRTLRDEAVQARLRDLGADVFVVCAYGLILPPAVLEATPHGCLNVHFSILPRLRGAAPVQWALIEGHERAGVTILQMDPGLDTGPIVEIAGTEVRPDDTAGTLEARLAHLGAGLLVEVLDRLERGGLTSRPQDDSRRTLAPKLTPADARIDWTMDAASIVRRVRAFNPRPGAWTMVGGRRLKVWRARTVEGARERPPGSIRAAEPPLEGLLAGTGTTEILLEEVQPAGSRRMPAADFLRGLRQGTEDRFT
ncbi:MAG: methionyl-tRNA formyltransferase [Actinomycetota bacterium]